MKSMKSPTYCSYCVASVSVWRLYSDDLEATWEAAPRYAIDSKQVEVVLLPDVPNEVLGP